MKINPIVVPSGLMQTVSRTLTRPVMHSGPGGMLSDSDIAFIKAATHTEFNWPPGDGEGSRRRPLNWQPCECARRQRTR